MALGPLPAVGEILFRAVQTYADGEVVRIASRRGAVEARAPSRKVRMACATR